MAPAMLERVAETTAHEEQIKQLKQLVDNFSEDFPWARELSLDDFVSMIKELGPAVAHWQQTKDATDLEELLAEWEATAQASKNQGLNEALSREDREFIPWE